jgi:hypothetical protein
MQVKHGVRTVPRQALVLALALVAVLVLAGLSTYLVAGRHSPTSTLVTAPHTSATSAPATIEQTQHDGSHDGSSDHGLVP